MKKLPICLKLFEIIIGIKAVRLGRYVALTNSPFGEGGGGIVFKSPCFPPFSKGEVKSRRDGH